MTRNVLLVSLLAVLAKSACGEDRGKILALTRGTVLAPEDDRLLVGQRVVIEDHCIADVSVESGSAVPQGAAVIDIEGLTLLPGLMDLHSHLLLHPYDEADWNDQVLKEPLEFRTIRAVLAAKATLEAGFTTLRDLAIEGAGFADVALRDAIAQGMIPGPRVFASTKAIVATGCYGPDGFDPRWEIPKGAQVADGVDGVRKAVREQIAAGADWIKVYADSRRRPGTSATPTFSAEELAAIVQEPKALDARSPLMRLPTKGSAALCWRVWPQSSTIIGPPSKSSH